MSDHLLVKPKQSTGRPAGLTLAGRSLLVRGFVLIKVKGDFDSDLHGNGFAIFRSWLKLPHPNRIERACIHIFAKRLQDACIAYGSVDFHGALDQYAAL